METQQIVVQLANAPEVRAVVQKGESTWAIDQTVVKYDDLSDSDKATWDAFVAMINSK
jgi:hypothetical protein